MRGCTGVSADDALWHPRVAGVPTVVIDAEISHPQLPARVLELV
jgi:hypothetical protein